MSFMTNDDEIKFLYFFSLRIPDTHLPNYGSMVVAYALAPHWYQDSNVT